MFQSDWLILRILHQSFEIESPKGHWSEVVVHLILFVIVIVPPRSNDHVDIGLFVSVEIKTSGWHIQQSGVVLKTFSY